MSMEFPCGKPPRPRQAWLTGTVDCNGREAGHCTEVRDGWLLLKEIRVEAIQNVIKKGWSCGELFSLGYLTVLCVQFSLSSQRQSGSAGPRPGLLVRASAALVREVIQQV